MFGDYFLFIDSVGERGNSVHWVAALVETAVTAASGLGATMQTPADSEDAEDEEGLRKDLNLR